MSLLKGWRRPSPAFCKAGEGHFQPLERLEKAMSSLLKRGLLSKFNCSATGWHSPSRCHARLSYCIAFKTLSHCQRKAITQGSSLPRFQLAPFSTKQKQFSNCLIRIPCWTSESNQARESGMVVFTNSGFWRRSGSRATRKNKYLKKASFSKQILKTSVILNTNTLNTTSTSKHIL